MTSCCAAKRPTTVRTRSAERKQILVALEQSSVDLALLRRQIVPVEGRHPRGTGVTELPTKLRVVRERQQRRRERLDLERGYPAPDVLVDERAQTGDVEGDDRGGHRQRLGRYHPEGLVTARHRDEVGAGQPIEAVGRGDPTDEPHPVADTQSVRLRDQVVAIGTVAPEDQILLDLVGDLRERLEEEVQSLLRSLEPTEVGDARAGPVVGVERTFVESVGDDGDLGPWVALR